MKLLTFKYRARASEIELKVSLKASQEILHSYSYFLADIVAYRGSVRSEK